MKHITLVASLLFHFPAYLLSDGFVLRTKSPGTINRDSNRFQSSLHAVTGEDNTSGLRFKASTTYRSKEVTLPDSSEQIDELRKFFSIDETNFHLLAKGTRNTVQEARENDIQPCLSSWTKEAIRMGADKLTPKDKVLSLSVTTPFLVFVLKVTAMIGVKLLWHSFDTNGNHENDQKNIVLPEYQFTLLSQTFTADGPPPLVFIFNQLTGINKTVKGTYKQPNHALFTVKAEPSSDHKRLSFVSRMTAELNIRFPEILLKLLPVAKERIEKEGSASLKRSMERDVPPGVDEFRNVFADWLMSANS
jgi:hypothetical protein